MGEIESPLTAVQRENRRLQEEIQRVMIHNTKLQRDLMALNTSREHIVAHGHERVAQLTDELKQIDGELLTVRGDCDRIIAVICEHKQSALVQSLGDLSFTIEEEDPESDHSTASTASSTSSFRSTRSASRSGGKCDAAPKGRPPLSHTASSHKMSIDIDAERSTSVSKPSARKISDAPLMSQRDTIMSRISRSVKKAQSVPSAGESARPSVQQSVDSPIHSPMLAYKANAVLRATQSHLNNFRRHSGPYRRNLDTVVL